MTLEKIEFEPFQKIARLKRQCIITEKIDGTNSTVYIGEDGDFMVASRTRWITPEDDNYGFAKWAYSHQDELLALGPGWHRGEWWGLGVQRGYGLTEKRFSLFNTSRWTEETLPACCSVVPVLYDGLFSTGAVDNALDNLRSSGSVASPGFMRPEGIVVYLPAARNLFKVTLEKDDEPKSKGE